MGNMVKTEADTGPTGSAVAENIKRLRGGLSYTEMSRRLQERAGWSINAVGIRRIESNERRVSVDDLVAFSVALDVSPVTLLMPSGVAADEILSVAAAEFKAAALWEWLIAEWPFPGRAGLAEFYARALPPWKLAVVEKRIADRHGAESLIELDEPITIQIEGPDGDD